MLDQPTTPAVSNSSSVKRIRFMSLGSFTLGSQRMAYYDRLRQIDHDFTEEKPDVYR
ncbi:MAG: hypothetical protein KME05_22005 [Gloeocapsa sp. UFS-A4-WI-NPMV-4B04]|nr:hypothetical protein [Gloeocapsa sp. UFS-A4-WI-NPMV-4B04]